jgi:hypothetical protein
LNIGNSDFALGIRKNKKGDRKLDVRGRQLITVSELLPEPQV